MMLLRWVAATERDAGSLSDGAEQGLGSEIYRHRSREHGDREVVVVWVEDGGAASQLKLDGCAAPVSWARHRWCVVSVIWAEESSTTGSMNAREW
ncbi:hypothetical protein M0R45_030946 [Rubus argutus]|uniref:MHC class I antigen n=1 Tax=Rubus argutus TaxID=59490 RepID=A0AAW1WG28_RUBAR